MTRGFVAQGPGWGICTYKAGVKDEALRMVHFYKIDGK
jgi:hypothetical protein